MYVSNSHRPRACQTTAAEPFGTGGELPPRSRLQEATAAPQTQQEATSGGAAGQEGYDVYVYEPQPLQEGEEKHIISVFVADEAGLINRVAGVFARRGAVPLRAACMVCSCGQWQENA